MPMPLWSPSPDSPLASLALLWIRLKHTVATVRTTQIHQAAHMPTHTPEHRQIQNNPAIKSGESGDHHLRLISIWQADRPVTVHQTTAVTCYNYFGTIFKSLRTNIEWPMQSSVTECKRQAHFDEKEYHSLRWRPVAIGTQRISFILQLEEETLEKEKAVPKLSVLHILPITSPALLEELICSFYSPQWQDRWLSRIPITWVMTTHYHCFTRTFCPVSEAMLDGAMVHTIYTANHF